ncbi:MAG: aldo/keto reductase, partial [Deinococcales bacterium]|nr:aldo/keto reductase [Chitinophagaceae bacterium]
AEACVNFGLHIDGVDSIALSAPLPEMVATNVAMITKKIPTEFWLAMSERGLMEQSIPC